ncbi:hypothetical protein ACQ4M3_33625 [Leptolyngbya sp. AN03gr2]|uniref:hypothetical protein n=1 Tax=unclassified Leptolyngbya TaxID=2650499 RepID=UPI003D31E0FF
MKILYHFLALVAAITSVSNIRAINAQSIETKQTQCQRFEAGLIQFNQNFSTFEPDETTRRKIMLNTLKILRNEMQRLNSEQYQDVKLQALQQQLLEDIKSGHDNLANYVSTTEPSEAADSNYTALQSLPYQIAEVVEQFEQYCGKADGAKSP